MKGLTTTIKEKNPYEYNGESLHISPHTNQSETADFNVVNKSKKFQCQDFHLEELVVLVMVL